MKKKKFSDPILWQEGKLLHNRYRKRKNKVFSRKLNSKVFLLFKNLNSIIRNPYNKTVLKRISSSKTRLSIKSVELFPPLDYTKIEFLDIYEFSELLVPYINCYFHYIHIFFNIRERSYIYLFFLEIPQQKNPQIVFDFYLKILHTRDYTLGVNPFVILFFTTFRLWRWSGEIEEYKKFYYPPTQKISLTVGCVANFYYDQHKFFS
jgi:hypothetical protein